jgi:regulator of PEP synthase PpsR (kinase-PPPase family)
LLADRDLDDYVDRSRIAAEIAYTRKLCAKHGWPIIDVTRRSVEETAATIIRLIQDRDLEKEDQEGEGVAVGQGHDE